MDDAPVERKSPCCRMGRPLIFAAVILLGIALAVFMMEFVLPEGWDVVALHSDDPAQVQEALGELGALYEASGRSDAQVLEVFQKVRVRAANHMQDHMHDEDLTLFNRWGEVWKTLNTVTGETLPVPVGIIRLGG